MNKRSDKQKGEKATQPKQADCNEVLVGGFELFDAVRRSR